MYNLAQTLQVSMAQLVQPLQVMSTTSPRYASMYRESIDNPGRFWGDLARSMLTWTKEFDEVMDCDMAEGKIRWFIGGKLNVSVNCLDRHDAESVALIWEKEDPGNHETVTYGALLEQTCRVANVLKRHGVEKGTVVAICIPYCPLLVASMLACTRIGAVHCVFLTECSSKALRARMDTVQPYAVITAAIKGKVQVVARVEEAVRGSNSVKKVFVAGKDVPDLVNYVQLEQAMAQENPVCEPEPMDSEDTLFIAFSSGTLGMPKPFKHSQAGFLLHNAVIFKYAFDFHKGDILMSNASVGWISSHSFPVYGPLCIGGTSVLFGCSPKHPDYGRCWEIVERLRITHICLGTPLVKQLQKAGDEFVNRYDRSSLKVIESGGDVLPPTVWDWCFRVAGNSQCKVVLKWGQTECLGALLTERSSENEKLFVSNAVVPFFGVELAIVKEKVAEAQNDYLKFEEVNKSSPGIIGKLCFRKPVPGISSGAVGTKAHSDYIESHFKRFAGYYYTEDVACYDEDGNCRFVGREVDVIDCHGERVLGRMDIESVMVAQSEVSQAAVVGYPLLTTGEGIFAFVVPSDPVKIDKSHLYASLKNAVAKNVGAFAEPDVIVYVRSLPQSHTTKIVHWALRVIATTFGNVLAEQQKGGYVDHGAKRSEPPMLSYSTYSSSVLTAALAPVIGETSAASLENQLCLLLSSDITLANPDSLHQILEELRVCCTSAPLVSSVH